MLQFINRNLLILFTCQLIFVTGTVLLVTVGGLVGYELAATPGLATLPVALMVVGTAAAAIPAAMIMAKMGRRWGFLLATGMAAGGAGIAVVAMQAQSFWLFCLATGLMGASLGFSQHFRYAAAESVAPAGVSYAVSFILLGSIAGALLPPELIALSSAADQDRPYRLAFLLVIGLYALAALAVSGFKPRAPMAEETSSASDSAPRSLWAVAAQPLFFTAVLAGVVGQGVMTYIMTATPISMNVNDGFSILETSEVIRAHVIAMYLPSLVTPWLISRWGLKPVMLAGLAAFAVTLMIGMAGQHMLHYWFALVLLGIGWNFLFVAGTTMLVTAYRDSERFKCQAFNDFSIFAGSALASLLAGSVLHSFSWTILLLSSVPLLLVMGLALLYLWRWQTRQAVAGSSL
ncbi:MAG: MFS transporter [Pseudomonadota bacterium]